MIGSRDLTRVVAGRNRCPLHPAPAMFKRPRFIFQAGVLDDFALRRSFFIGLGDELFVFAYLLLAGLDARLSPIASATIP